MTRATTSTPYGVGISTEGRHPRKLNYPAYRCWQQMLQRCYCEKAQEKQSSYQGCTVCDEWLHYQTFADWFVVQRGSNLGWQLDKDLLSEQSRGNKIYCPETCILLPEYLNKVLTLKEKQSELPTGVHYNNSKTAFVARFRNLEGRNTHIGTFKVVQDAARAYLKKKQELLQSLANSYKDLLDIRAFQALQHYYY
jgi:hypothetical protein